MLSAAAIPNVCASNKLIATALMTVDLPPVFGTSQYHVVMQLIVIECNIIFNNCICINKRIPRILELEYTACLNQ